MGAHNKVCDLRDWSSPELTAAMRRIVPGFLTQSADYPRGMEHRKHWEMAQVACSFDELGVGGEDALVLSVAAGHEPLLFDLTNRFRWVFAIDRYGVSEFSDNEADSRFLLDPESYASCQYNRNRLVVEHMDALDLRFEDDTFDGAYSLSSVEHFGGLEGVVAALQEMARVVRPGGVVAFTTEVVVNGADPYQADNLHLFTPREIDEVSRAVADLELVEPIDFSLGERTGIPVLSLRKAVEDNRRGHTDYPHIVLEIDGREFTSVSVFLQKTGTGSSRS
jgi:SAM-dependent methyltransferase